jgi:hypothetical protein
MFSLTVEQVKEAVASWANESGLFGEDVEIKPDHVVVKMRSEGNYDERADIFDGFAIDITRAFREGVEGKAKKR